MTGAGRPHKYWRIPLRTNVAFWRRCWMNLRAASEIDSLLPRLYESVRPAVIAFASRVVQKDNPQFPFIVGTGFVVDERGIVATNRHVVEALMQLPPYPPTGESSAFAMVSMGVERRGQ